MEEEITGRLENWSIVKKFDENSIILGNCFDDIRGRFHDGEAIYTSRIIYPAIGDITEGVVVSTKNSKYILGKKNNNC